ncbi:hypothetical protein C2869_19185 [Saccharobesus litoralis]|uniref:Multidrug resistance protein MdtA-like barrel-sandwich hybrid domain-containing protein n=1 Tax=Saccharobesus litoralis TaxID=2172099 RepID=A0A2S0VW11_9ALTE|nr:efflux RND transporter periplasmic adaptor subunit [Saccharobesus litoralis]AWB68398.1 hypothetical protein C2869_19185 [Saccharobesus litoralis]
MWQRIPLAIKILIPSLVVIGLVATQKPKPEPVKQENTTPNKPMVNVVYAQPQAHHLQITSQGTVKPKTAINLVSRVAGNITYVAPQFNDGGFIKKEQILVKIDKSDYHLALIRAKANLATAQMQLAQEKGLARQAKREWRDLGNQEANSLFLREPQITAAKANVSAAQAEVKQAELNLQRTEIKAPFSGRIQQIMVNVGQYIGANQQLASLFDSTVMQVSLPLSEQQAALINLPLNPQVTNLPQVVLSGSVAGQNATWQGQVVRTQASVNTQSRMYYGIVEVIQDINSPTPLINGQFVNAKISGKAIEQVARLPKQAVFKRDQIYWLKDDKIVAGQVEVLNQDNQYVWVKSAMLTPDLAIIADRQGYVTPGTAVEINLENIKSPVDPEPTSTANTENPEQSPPSRSATGDAAPQNTATGDKA